MCFLDSFSSVIFFIFSKINQVRDHNILNYVIHCNRYLITRNYCPLFHDYRVHRLSAGFLPLHPYSIQLIKTLRLQTIKKNTRCIDGEPWITKVFNHSIAVILDISTTNPMGCKTVWRYHTKFRQINIFGKMFLNYILK